ncbi:hypothetical protein [Vallitalea maricola]|uniref:Uncharacterized protein n=1 Tax=Vallitalea maricola TaxID=3074433 RepID=A0ACB5UFW6_9FIRM|nr:hypothetical protein AN2V17_10720 [Vallitalea sp. AN17-2]
MIRYFAHFTRKMLKPIPLNKIHNQSDYNNDISIDFNSIKSFDIDFLDNSIESIIINNINIQIGLGMLFPFKDLSKDNNFRENIGFLDNKPIDQQIKEIQKIFSNLLLIKVDGKPCIVQVSKPADEIFHIFKKLSNEGKLNKWVSYFLLRKPKDDVTEVSGYEYILDSQSIDVSPYYYKLNEDEFFKYFRFNNRNIISNRCIPVSGFTLDEIDSDPCIKAFSKIVKKLYVYTSEGGISTKYDKFIKWVEK